MAGLAEKGVAVEKTSIGGNRGFGWIPKHGFGPKLNYWRQLRVDTKVLTQKILSIGGKCGKDLQQGNASVGGGHQSIDFSKCVQGRRVGGYSISG